LSIFSGQKARVSLARVAYSAPEIVLCDDPLSALDASTGKKIFDRLFKSKDNSLLASSAIVLVTHAAHFLNQVDQIMVMVQGQAKFLGTWDELVNARTDEEVAAKAIDFIRLSVQEVGDHDNDAREEVLDDQTSLGELRNGKPPPEEKGTIMSIETREHGLSKLGTWLLWFKYAGGLPFLFTQVLLLGLDRFFYIVTELWLTVWTKGHDQPVESLGREFPAQTDGRSAQYEYVLVYAIILAVSSVATFLR
jgi:ATP-binding cassette subfamily C (CFTR/MRP) protein 1